MISNRPVPGFLTAAPRLSAPPASAYAPLPAVRTTSILDDRTAGPDVMANVASLAKTVWAAIVAFTGQAARAVSQALAKA